ncbi:MAG: SpoIIE family protein phosphatase [Spirochaetes bacterium]|jgi:sigma-B regulation protein RsbU (phosphoserine phosphatase)|nr:SpoIIE family protein phosphatase [Spirochaetota bacterium]
MRLFYFIAKKISYTFAIVIITIFGAWFATMFAYFLGTSFILFSYDKIISIMVKWLQVAFFGASFCHFIQYGLLTPLKIPAFSGHHKKINAYFKNDFDVEDVELKEVYGYICDLPMHNLVTSALYVALGIFIIAGFSFYEYSIISAITIEELKMIFKVITVSGIVVAILYGMSTYLLTELLTNNERSNIYNMLLRRNIRIRPKILIGIRIKFLFFVMLLVLTLLTYAALMERSRFYGDLKIEIILSYIVISIFAGYLLMQVTTRSILRILEDLRRVAREIASGGRAGFHVLALEKEFASIEFAMMEMAWEIDEYRKNLEDKVEQRTNELQSALTDLKSRDDQIQKQLDMASVIQRSILPSRINDWNELKFAVRYVAMEKIGGDFYDVQQLKDDKLGIMIADVSGHGIPAALVTTMAKITFGNAGSKYDSPKKIFQEVNKNILSHIKTQDYMTCFMLAIDDEYNVTYSNASHQKAILLRTARAEIEHLDTNGLFIGAVEDAGDTYEEKTTRLEYGDRIILYTDGIPESINEERKEYSNSRLDEIIISNRHLPLEEFSSFIIKDVQNFVGNAPVVDDITIMTIELVRDEAVDIIKNSKKMINTHNYQDAIGLLENGLQKFAHNQKILYNLGKNHFRINNYPSALKFMQEYIDNDQRNKYAYYIVGASYYQMEDFLNAIHNFERALSLDGNFVNALFAQGMAYKKMGDGTEAAKNFEKVINLDPDNKMALFELKELKM